MTNVSETQEVVIEITPELVSGGKCKSSKSCPIALAINSHLIEQCWSAVGVVDVAIVLGNMERCRVKLPIAARKFVNRYDFKSPVDLPLRFPLSIPKQFLKETA